MEAVWARIAEKIVASQDPFFAAKVRINEVVLREVARAAFPDEDDVRAQNEAATALLESKIHDHINDLAREIVAEVERIRRESESPMRQAPEAAAE